MGVEMFGLDEMMSSGGSGGGATVLLAEFPGGKSTGPEREGAFRGR